MSMVYDEDIFGEAFRNPEGFRKKNANREIYTNKVCDKCDGEGECFIDPPQHGNHYLPCEECNGTGEIEIIS